MRDTHTHPCTVCRAETPCEGARERNHDGFPSVICAAYHLPNGDVATVWCETCANGPRCYDCADPATTERRVHTGPYTYVMELMCDGCAERFDNREPPDVKFDEALGAKCDESMRMDEARRLKR